MRRDQQTLRRRCACRGATVTVLSTGPVFIELWLRPMYR